MHRAVLIIWLSELGMLNKRDKQKHAKLWTRIEKDLSSPSERVQRWCFSKSSHQLRLKTEDNGCRDNRFKWRYVWIRKVNL